MEHISHSGLSKNITNLSDCTKQGCPSIIQTPAPIESQIFFPPLVLISRAKYQK